MSKTRTTSLMDNAKKVNDEIMKLGRNTYLLGLGAVATAEEEARVVYDRILAKGEDSEKKDDTLIGKAAGRARKFGEQVEHTVQETVSSTLHRAGVPSRDEIRTLIHRVEQLTEKVDQLGASR